MTSRPYNSFQSLFGSYCAVHIRSTDNPNNSPSLPSPLLRSVRPPSLPKPSTSDRSLTLRLSHPPLFTSYSHSLPCDSSFPPFSSSPPSPSPPSPPLLSLPPPPETSLPSVRPPLKLDPAWRRSSFEGGRRRTRRPPLLVLVRKAPLPLRAARLASAARQLGGTLPPLSEMALSQAGLGKGGQGRDEEDREIGFVGCRRGEEGGVVHLELCFPG
jgi:hypothetical protein